MLFVKPIYLSRKYAKEDKIVTQKSKDYLRNNDSKFDSLDEKEQKSLIKQQTEEEEWHKNISDGEGA